MDSSWPGEDDSPAVRGKGGHKAPSSPNDHTVPWERKRDQSLRAFHATSMVVIEEDLLSEDDTESGTYRMRAISASIPCPLL